jgi:AcrR family transcriptional regulator
VSGPDARVGCDTNQKARTRAAIIAAAQELQRQGTTPTVEQAADQARVSRATAYRYFPTKKALLVEVSDITPALAPVEAMLANSTPGDVEQRLLLLLDTFNPIVLAEEERVRTGLRVYQDTWLRSHRNGDNTPVVREGRRMRWLETVLAPLGDLPPERQRLLKAALALTLGPDAIITLKDVCGLDNDETLTVLRWAATALLRAALSEAPA